MAIKQQHEQPHRAKWKMPKPVRWLGIWIFYCVGAASLWLFERTYLDTEETEWGQGYFWSDWLWNTYQYCMLLSCDLDIFSWIWKEKLNNVDYDL